MICQMSMYLWDPTSNYKFNKDYQDQYAVVLYFSHQAERGISRPKVLHSEDQCNIPEPQPSPAQPRLEIEIIVFLLICSSVNYELVTGLWWMPVTRKERM